MVSQDEQLIGQIFCERYEILELVGKGGMGTVFRSRQLQIDREVALKVIHRRLTHDEKSVLRFEKEARASSKLHHPNNIRVYDYGKSDDDRLFIAMEYLRGQTLGDLITNEGPLPPARVVHITRQIGKSLAEAHQVGLVHRDLKPENIFICDIHGEPDFVKVLDFGIAKAVGGDGEHANLTQTGFICGTPRYISPEQALGQPVDGRSDLYAVAVLMYEMLTGRPPFMGENPISIVMMHVYDDPPPLVGMERYGLLGKRLTRLVGHMLEKNPNRRPGSSEKVIAFLDGRIDENELVGRQVSDPIPVLSAAEIHSTAYMTGAPPQLPTFQEATSTEQTNPSGAPAPPEPITNQGIAAPVAPVHDTSPDEATIMVPGTVSTPDTQSEMPTAFTARPEALRSVASQQVTSATGADPVDLSKLSADETAQIHGGQLKEAVDLLKKQRGSAKGLVRRPSSTSNFRGIKRHKGPLTPTPSGSTGLNLKTLPPPPSAPRPPTWALLMMGVAIAVISVSVAALVMSNDKGKPGNTVATDEIMSAATLKEVPKSPAAAGQSDELAAVKGEGPPPAVEVKVVEVPDGPKEVPAPEKITLPTTAGQLVGIHLAALERPELPKKEEIVHPKPAPRPKRIVPRVEKRPVKKKATVVKKKPRPTRKPIKKKTKYRAGDWTF